MNYWAIKLTYKNSHFYSVQREKVRGPTKNSFSPYPCSTPCQHYRFDYERMSHGDTQNWQVLSQSRCTEYRQYSYKKYYKWQYEINNDNYCRRHSPLKIFGCALCVKYWTSYYINDIYPFSCCSKRQAYEIK